MEDHIWPKFKTYDEISTSYNANNCLADLTGKTFDILI